MKDTSKIQEINVYSQTKTTRVYVGRLWRGEKKYFFEYGKAYRKLRNGLPLGPELPLWKSKFSSSVLFPSFLDRLPSKENPAYKDYCRQWGISENEKDIFVLLSTIGHRGPSTFIFEAGDRNIYTATQLKEFRRRLGLTQSEFEVLFGLSHMTLSQLEAGKSKSGFYLSYFELFDKVPEALAWLVEKRHQLLHDEKRTQILEQLTTNGLINTDRRPDNKRP